MQLPHSHTARRGSLRHAARRLRRSIPAACAAGALGLLAGGCGRPAPSGVGTVFRGGSDAPIAVETAIVGPRALAETVLLTGELSAPETVDVRPTIAGRLERLEREDGRRFEEGCVVRRGEVIATLDRRESTAQLALTDAAVQIAEVQLNEAARERQRADNLYREGSLTAQRRDAAVTAHELAEAKLRQARAQRERAAVQHDETVLRAPFDGVIVARHVDPGALVSPSTPFLRLAAMNPLRFVVDLPVRLLPRIVPGETAIDVHTDVYPDRPLRGIVRRVFPTVDPATRTVRLELLLPNPPGATNGTGLLRPGMYARAAITLTTRDNALAVPFDAVNRIRGETVVYVVRGDRIEVRPVVLGIRTGALQEISAGLAAGDEIVVVGQHKLTDGSVVRNAAAAPATSAEDRP